MSLSNSVEESLKEAESSLRNALSFSARQESPYVSCTISELILKIDQLIKTDQFIDTMDKIMKKYENDEK